MERAAIRLCVTGSRGKSGIVRLLHAALCACGLNCRSRITGVVPRELTPSGEIPILRHAGAHVNEMRWWLSRLPSDVQAIVMENSAVSPDLQPLCPEILRPTYTILTNVRLDHSSAWGSDENSVIRALAFGLPFGGSVILPEAISNRPAVMHEAQRRKLTLIPVAENKNLPHPLSINVPLALEACTRCFLDKNVCFNAMMSLPPDIADSSVIKVGMGALAFAFSVNDTESTEEYFASLGWARKDTVLLYNHRHDRVDRLASFSPWFDLEWREKYIIGDSPLYGRMSDFYLKLKDIKELACFIDKKERVFGCGNAVYGLPLKLKLALEKGRNVL